MIETTEYALASYCATCDAMLGMCMELPGMKRDLASFQRHELNAGRRIQRVPVEETRRKIVAQCKCELGGAA